MDLVSITTSSAIITHRFYFCPEWKKKLRKEERLMIPSNTSVETLPLFFTIMIFMNSIDIGKGLKQDSEFKFNQFLKKKNH